MAKFGNLKTIVPTVTTNIGTKSGSVQAIVTGGPSGTYDSWQPNIIDDPASGTCRLDISTGGGNLGAEIIYDFGEPVSVGGVRYIGGTNAPFGRWQLYGSQTGTLWSPIGFETNPRFGIGGMPNTGYGDIPSMQLPFRILDVIAAGWGYTLDLDQVPFWWSNTLFFRFFKLVGVESAWPSFPVDGNASLPPFKITLFDLVAAERRKNENRLEPLGQAEVWGDPFNSSYLGPDDGSRGTPAGGGGSSGGGPVAPPDDMPPPPPPPPPPSDYFHPYSRGVRGALYNASTGPGNIGNGVTAQISSTNPPTVFGGPEAGVNWNFGAAAGDGPYLGGVYPGFRYEWTFPTPVILTGLLSICNEANNQAFGFWKLMAFDAGSWREISDPTEMRFPAKVPNNSVWGNAAEFLIRGGSDVVTSTRFALQYISGPGDGRIANEWVFKIANSPLQGGDRRAVSTSTDVVSVTSNFALSHSDGGTFTPDKLQRLVDSVLSTGNGGGNGDLVLTVPDADVRGPKSPPYGQGRSASYIHFDNANDPAGSYFQFRFQRGVVIRTIQPYIWGPREELDGSGNPTKWGWWKMMWADTEAGPYTDVGEPFTWGDHAQAPFCDIQNDDNAPHSFWRLVKVSGNQINTGGAGLEQFQFLLEDVGDPTPYPINFNDDEGTSTFNAEPTITINHTDPSAIKVPFKDDTGFSAVPTFHYVKFITAAFADDNGLEVFSELSPSIVTQVHVVATGTI